MEELESAIFSDTESYSSLNVEYQDVLDYYNDQPNARGGTLMSLGKKTIKMVTKLLGDDKRRQLYTEEEIKYMERQVVLLKLQRARRLHQRKLDKGFGY